MPIAGALEPWHLVLILLIAIVVFGPSRIGDIGGSLGRGIREFKQSINSDEPLPPPTKKEEKPKATSATTVNGTANGTTVTSTETTATTTKTTE